MLPVIFVVVIGITPQFFLFFSYETILFFGLGISFIERDSFLTLSASDAAYISSSVITKEEARGWIRDMTLVFIWRGARVALYEELVQTVDFLILWSGT